MDTTKLINEMYWNSTQVKRTKYNEEKKILTVEFNNRGVYEYDKVPVELWQELIKCESIGKFLNEKIKGAFSYTKIK